MKREIQLSVTIPDGLIGSTEFATFPLNGTYENIVEALRAAIPMVWLACLERQGLNEGVRSKKEGI